MHRGMRNPRGLKLGRYSSCMIDLKKYLVLLPGANISDYMCMTELNENLLNSMPNSWSKQAYVQVFYCEYITFKAAVNMF